MSFDKLQATLCMTNPENGESCQEDQRPSEAGYFGEAEAPVANPSSGSKQDICPLEKQFGENRILGECVYPLCVMLEFR